MAARAGRPLLIVDIAMPRDVDPDVRRSRRRHPARHGRPARLRRGRLVEAPPRDRRGAARSSTRRSTATSARSSAREVAPLDRRAPAPLGRRVVADELSGTPRSWPSSIRPSAKRSRRCVQGIVAKLLHEPTVALEGAAGSPRGERLVEVAPRAVRPLTSTRGRSPLRDRVAIATRGSRPRPLAGRARGADCCARRTRPRRWSWWWSRPRATGALDVPICRDRRQGRVRQGGAGRGARRPRRPRGALGQGSAGAHARRAGDRRGARARPIPATRWSGRRLADLPDRARSWRPARRAAACSCRPAARSALRSSCAATSTPGWRRSAEFDAIVVAARGARAPRAATGDVVEVLDARRDGAAGGPGRAGRRVPRRRRGDASAARAHRARPDDAPGVDAERAFLVELGGDCDLPGRRPRRRVGERRRDRRSRRVLAGRVRRPVPRDRS